jgi:ubiquinone/menaquinone biosynthesis C-methylase UbiE
MSRAEKKRVMENDMKE